MKQEECTCKFCSKVCRNKMSKVRHEYFCKLNPAYQENLEHHRQTTVKASKTEAVEQIRKASRKERRAKFLEEHPEEQVKEFKFVCEKCGKDFFRSMKVKHYESSSVLPRFCSNACANSHANTAESRKKISAGVKKERDHVCPKCGKHFLSPGTAINSVICQNCRGRDNRQLNSPNNIKVGENLYQMEFIFQYPVHCAQCGKWFFPKKRETTCSKKCFVKLVSENGKLAYKRTTESGKFKGWKPRSTESYPEKYWSEVLTNLGISFEREVRCIPKHLFSLDFLIHLKNGQNIDLEIDGKQHRYDDRRLYDEWRNKIVRENGFLVYRIDWNNLNSELGLMRMHAKINQFVWWYNHVNI